MQEAQFLAWIVYAFFVLSLIANVLAFRQILTAKKKNRVKQDYDATMLLHDLTQYNAAVVKIERIDPNEIFWRSPKDKNQ